MFYIGPLIEARFHMTGTQGGNFHVGACAAEFLVESFREAENVGLGGVIGGHQGAGKKTGGGGNVEDVAAILRHKILQEQFGEDMNGADIQVYHVQFRFQGDFPEMAEGTKAGVVDEDVDVF